MATSTSTKSSIPSASLRILNAATKQELKLIKKSGHYQVGSEILTGDLYRDETNLSLAILVVAGSIRIEELKLPDTSVETNGK